LRARGAGALSHVSLSPRSDAPLSPSAEQEPSAVRGARGGGRGAAGAWAALLGGWRAHLCRAVLRCAVLRCALLRSAVAALPRDHLL